MNPATYHQWVVQGLEGAASMVCTLADSDARPTDAQAERLRVTVEKLKEALVKWQAKSTG